MSPADVPTDLDLASSHQSTTMSHVEPAAMTPHITLSPSGHLLSQLGDEDATSRDRLGAGFTASSASLGYLSPDGNRCSIDPSLNW
jgi:hypothetical protein